MLAVLLLATALRFHWLEAQSFWNDEGNSARLSERSLPLIIEGTASDIHPPLYYLGLHGWRELVGSTEFGLRAFSAFAGVATVAVTYALAGALFGRGSLVAPLAALLTAVNPALVYYSQEARMYALLAFLGTLSSFFLVAWLQRMGRVWANARRSRDGRFLPAGGVAFAYIVCAAAGLYTHYFFAAVLLAHNLIVLVVIAIRFVGRRSGHEGGSWLPWLPASASRPWMVLISWLAMMGATFLLFLPWLPVFLQQVGGRVEPDLALSQFLLQSGRWLAFGRTIEAASVYAALPAVVLLLLLGLLVGRWRALVAGVTLVVSVLLMFAAGTTQPQFFKFMVVAVPPFVLVMAQAAAGRRRWGKEIRPFLLLLIVILLWHNARSLQNLYANPAYARADYRGMAAHIAAEDHANAGIILSAPNQWEVFTYYHRQGAPVYPLPRGQPRADAIADELSQIAARHERLYVLFWGEGQQDPQRLVERWLDENAYKAREEWVGDVRFVTYAVPKKPVTEMETAVDLRFGDVITLKGYTLRDETVAPGDIVQLALFWQTAEPLVERYKVFLHLVDENGRLVAQRDSEPGGGLRLTTVWQPGETVIDNHGLLVPADTPAADYRLLLGLYPLSDASARLPIQTAKAVRPGVDDAFPLATISVTDK